MRLGRRAGLALVVITGACVTDLSVGPRVVASLAITPDAPAIVVGATQQLLAIARDANGVPFVGLATTWSSSAPLIATVTPSGLMAGMGIGSATITATSGGQTATTPVTVTPAPVLGLSRTSVPIAGTPGAPDPAAETVSIANTGGGTLDNIQLGTIVYSGGASGWLNAALDQASAPATLTLTAATGTLALGSYTATVPVTSATATNSPQNVTVTFTVAAGAATSLALNAGDGQSAAVGTAVTVPPSVIARDAFNNPVAGVQVTFAIAGGGGTLSGTNPATTDASGVAQIVWTVGNSLGANSLTASATGLAGGPVTFTAIATAGAPSLIAVHAGDGQSATVNSAVAVAPAVLVTDAFGNPVAGVTVTFAVAAGGGNVSVPNQSTDASGIAQVGGWTLGLTAGSNSLTATAPGLTGSPVTFTATATAGPATQLAKNAGDNQSATVNTAVATAPRVIVTDAFGNPIAGIAVTFAVTSGGGSTSGTNPATTDASGFAQVGWTLGTTAGSNTLSASASGLTTVNFTATGTAGAATEIVKTAGDAQSATVATAVAIPPRVQTRDQFGNGVPGVSVTFAIAGGGGSLTGTNPALTDAAGFAQSGWTLGNAIGPNSLTAAASGLTGSPLTFTATATAGGATQIALSTGDGQSATVNTAVTTPPRVLVTDALGNPVSGVAVTFAVATGGGSVGGANQVTNASGLAQVGAWTLGTTAGSNNNTLIATASGLTGSPVTFTASATAGAATQIAISAGDGQSATVNTAVATAPRVVVRDGFNNPVAGVSVTFALTGGGGSLTGPSPTTTNASGFAQIGWTLGTTAGVNTLSAAATGLTGSPLTFTATGTAGAATQIAVQAGNNQTATVNTAVAVSPAVLVTDAFGNPVSGVGVTFAVASGGGSISSGAQTTDAGGSAQLLTWTLGTAAGANTLTATSAGLTGSPVTFTATGTPGGATQLVKTAGDNQTAGAGGQVAVAPQVQARDAFDNGVPGVSVAFAVTSGGGSLVGSSPVTTNAAGFAEIGWTLGATAGANTLTATAAGLTGSPATFAATGTAGGATQITASAGAGQSATVNTPVATAPAVLVRDALGNPVAGVNVTFTLTGGGGTIAPASPATIATDGSGIAAVTSWTLGTTAGSNTLTATATGLSGSPVTFTATGTAGAAAQIAIQAGDGQSATVNTTVATAPAALVRDAFNNPVAGVNVTFTVTGGAGTIDPAAPAIVATNASGIAALTSWTLGQTAGANSLSATATGLTGSPLAFTATGSAGAATQIAIQAGNGQSATVNTAVATPPAALVRDAFNNPVSGVNVTFTVTGGGGSINPASPAIVATNASGIAALTSWTLGQTAGANALSATATGLTGSPLAFSATGFAGAPTQIAKTAGDNQSAQVSSAVPTPPQVQAQDQFGNGVDGVDITFTEADGGTIVPASPAVIATAAGGFATLTSWTLGSTVTTYAVTAMAAGLAGSPQVTFTATSFAAGADTMALSAGDNQTATVGATLPVAYAVLVTDSLGNPVPGIPVTWTVTNGGGSITPPSSATNASGIATASRTLSTTAGVHTATASVGGLNGSPVEFTATATAGAATQIAIQAGNGQSATVSTAVATAPAAIVRDAFNNPVSGVNVAFTVTGGGGTISPASPATVATNASGIAALTSWTLGQTAGANTVSATAAGLTGSPLAFTATGTAGAPTQIVIQAGNGQSATVNTAVAAAPAAIVRDAFNNPVSGVSVTFTVTGGGGTIDPASPAIVATNASGIAALTSWTLGQTAGANTLGAAAAALSPLTFTATGTAGAATQITIQAGNGQSATVNTTVATAPAALVRDAFNNPVGGVNVTFTVTGGDGAIDPASPAIIATNASGLATLTSWTLGQTAGANTLSAAATGLAGSPLTFSATGTAGAPSAAQSSVAATSPVTASGGASQSTVTVTVRDQFSNPVSGASVTLASSGGGNTVIQPVATTNAGGITTGALSSTVAESKTVSATINGSLGIPQTATVVVNPAVASAAQSTVTAGTASITACASSCVPGSTSSTLTVTARDAFGNLIPGAAVVLAASGGTNSFAPAGSGSANGGGVFVAAFSSTTAQAKTISATIDGIGVTQTAGVTVVADLAASITLNAGDNQSAVVNTSVAVAPSVIVRDQFSNPVPGHTVTFAVTGGGGSVNPVTAVGTDGLGIAQPTSWTLGTVAGTGNNTLTATSGGLAGSPVTFTASATAGAATQLTKNAGDGQSATVNTAVGTAPQVLVRDAFNNPVPGASVTFAVTGGGGSLNGTNPVATNASGLAQIGWFLGTTAGGNTLQASVSGTTPVTFNATGTAGAATQIAIQAGNGQTATVNTAVGTAPAVLVRDAFNNPVGSVGVTFTVTAGGGSTNPVSGSTVFTNASGIAAVTTWTLGTGAGTSNNTLQAASAGLSGSPLSFTASATAGAATQIALSAGNAQSATVNSQVAIDPAVLVRDAFSNPVAGVNVTFTVTGGGGSTVPVSGSTVATNASGIAAVTSWTLGTTAGTNNNTLSATGAGLSGSPVIFTASATAGAPSASQSSVSATSPIIACQVSCVGASQRSTVTVTVRDAFNNPIGGATVSLSATGSNNTIGQPGSVTNSSGQTTGTLSSFTTGSKVVTALVNGAVTVTQTATVVVNPDIVNAATSTVTRATATISACLSSCVAGSTASTITVTARDQFSNTVPSVPVTIASSGANNTFVPASGSTNGSGVFTTNFNSNLAQAKTITATANGVAITQTAAVTVIAATATSIAFTAGAGQTARVGNAVGTDPSVTVTDAFGNLASGRNVTFTVTAGGGSTSPASPAVVVTNASGVATLTSWTLGGTSVDAAGGTMANTLNASVSPCNPGTCSVNLNASAIYIWSLDVASLFNASSPYGCNSCHTVVFNRNPNNLVGVGANTGSSCTGQIRVNAGSAATSLLYLKVDSNTVNQCGSKMPFTASFFTAAELKRLRAWINNGAQNN